MVIRNQQKGEFKMIDELNALVEALQAKNTSKNLDKLKSFVEKEAKRELAEIEQNQWLSSREQLLNEISPNITSQAKKNWLKLIEHIRKRLMENNGKIIKLVIYSSIWSWYLFLGSFVSVMCLAISLKL